MNKLLPITSVLLLLSLALNLFFYTKLHTLSNGPIFEEQPQMPAADTQGHSASEYLSPFEKHPENESSENFTKYSQSGIQSSSQPLDISVLSREQILNQAKQWLSQKNVPALTALLQAYLKQHPHDMDLLLIEAQLKIETGLLSDAVIHYYSLLRQPMTGAQQQHIEQQIRRLASETINQLKSTYSWDLLAEFVEPLLQVEPDNRLYIVSLARAYAEQLQQALMENILASLPFNDPSANSIRQRLSNLQARSAQVDTNEPQAFDSDQPQGLSKSISLLQYGDQFVVEATLDNQPVSLLIDTGASITTISKGYFNRIKQSTTQKYLGQFNFSTAGGLVRASIYRFNQLRIGPIKVDNISVAVLPMDSLEKASGLLGMNFLREFDFKIDQKQALMHIY